MKMPVHEYIVGKGASVIQCAEMTETIPIDGEGDYMCHSTLSAFCFIPLWKHLLMGSSITVIVCVNSKTAQL
jgi:hypothetical protein